MNKYKKNSFCFQSPLPPFLFLTYLSYMRIIRLTESDLVKLVRQVINEETTNLVDFVETLKSTYEMSDELADFVVDFIEKSNCQKIEFANRIKIIIEWRFALSYFPRICLLDSHFIQHFLI